MSGTCAVCGHIAHNGRCDADLDQERRCRCGSVDCETCGQPIEQLRGIWQHTASRLIGCRGEDGWPIEGHAYPADWRERRCDSKEFHRRGECGGDCSGCCDDEEMTS